MQAEIDDLAFCPSFNCYFSDSLTSTAAAKVSRELKQEQAAKFHEFSDVDEVPFDFLMEFSDEEVSGRLIDLEASPFVFPIFNTELLTENHVDLEVEKIDPVKIQCQKAYSDDRKEYSSSGAGELEGRSSSGMFCLWMSKDDVVVSSPVSKCKKVGSTRSGSSLTAKIRNLLRWRNNKGKESMILFLWFKKFRASKQIRNVDSDEVTKFAGN